MVTIGISAFGPAYQRMLEQDPHAPGSADRVLISRMIRLDPESQQLLYGTAPRAACYRPGSRPLLEAYLRQICNSATDYTQAIAGIARFCSGMGSSVCDDIDALRFGGTEEQIVARGSDWCTDVARVACVLCEVAGFPSRIVQLFDIERAHSGHVVIEAHNGSSWGLVDPVQNVVYRDRQRGISLSALDLMMHRDQVQSYFPPQRAHEQADLFRGATIVDYRIEEAPRFNYDVSAINTYYRAILEHSQQGWPGGLRWLFGEDTEVPDLPDTAAH